MGEGAPCRSKTGLEAQVRALSGGDSLPHMPKVISIAKPDENRQETCDKIYVFGRKNPLNLRADHPVLLLMMRIRDEVHRRAVSYHRGLRGKHLTTSALDEIPGIGEKEGRFYSNISKI